MPPNDNFVENYLKRTVVKPSCPHLEGGPTYLTCFVEIYFLCPFTLGYLMFYNRCNKERVIFLENEEVVLQCSRVTYKLTNYDIISYLS